MAPWAQTDHPSQQVKALLLPQATAVRVVRRRKTEALLVQKSRSCQRYPRAETAVVMHRFHEKSKAKSASSVVEMHAEVAANDELEYVVELS